MFSSNEADALFKRLDLELMENIDAQYFSETREFRSLNEVLEVLSQKVDQINRTAGDASNDLLTVLKDRNPAYSKLLNQRKIVEEVIEDVVKFQHGGLNHSVDTMSEVVREYTRGRDDIQGLRKSLAETQAVLTAKKVGQVPLKELWQKKVELQETLRIVKDLESLKSAPHRVQRLMQQKRYLSAVTTLNKAITVMFGEDLVGVRGLSALREQLMDMKETLLETCVGELKAAVVVSSAEMLMKDYNSASDSEEEEEAATADNRSGSHVTSTHINDEVRSIVSQSHAGGGGGGGGGGTSSGHSVAGGGGPGTRGSSEAWPVDLRDLDESLETTLGDPSESGSLYIRLLVRTVGVLECEEDVERMVLDGVVDRFKETVVQQVRENAASKLAKELNREKRHGRGVGAGAVVSPGGGGGLEEDDVLAVHRRLFTSFIGSLLDCTLQALRRVLYLLKLLYVSKAMRGGAAPASTHIDADKAIKEHNKRQVLQVWMGMEELVVQQMLTHLVEPDVAGITDAGSGHAQGLVSKYGSQNRDGFLLLERSDRAVDDNEVELIFTPSARHAAPIFRRVVSYASLAAKILRDNALEEFRLAMQAARAAHVSPSGPMGSPSRSNSSTSPLSSPTAAAGHGILEVIQAFLETELIPVIQSTVNHDMREIQMNNAYFSVAQNAPVAPLVLELGDDAADTETVIGGGGNGNGRVAAGAGQKRAASDTVPLCYAVQLCVNASRPLFSYWLQLHQHRGMVSTVLDRLIRGFASAAREELEGLTYSCMVMTLEGVHSSLIQSTKLDPLYRAYRMRVFGPNKATVEDLFGAAASAVGGQGGAAEASKGLARRSFMPGGGVGGSAGGVGGHGRRSLKGSHVHGGGEYGDQDEARGRNALEVSVWEQLDFFDVGNHNYPVTAQKIVKDFPAVATVASISYACDWLIKRLSSFSSAAVRKVSAPSHHSPSPNPGSPQLAGPGRKQVASLPVTSSSASQPGGGGVGSSGAGGAGSRQSLSALLRANKSELQEQKQLLVSTVVSGVRELSKIAEEGMALMRGELQLICFYFLHRLAHVVYAPPSAVDGSPHRKSFSGSPLAAQRASIAGAGTAVGRAHEEGIGEEEAILSAFNAHLAGYLQAVVSSTSTDALAALLSPLCTVIPRILTHCAMHMVAENDKAESDDEAEGGLGSDHYLKTHLLRMVVSVQQSFALQIQSFPVQLETKRRLTDLLTDGFERSRRFITMFGMPASELKVYLKTNVNDYSKEEAEILWVKSTDRDVTFAQLWKELENIPRTGPKPSAALQFSR